MQNDVDFEPGLCPSFNSYSSDKLADIAAKVCREFNDLDLLEESNSKSGQQESEDVEEEDDAFEFVSFQKSAGEVFFDQGGRIGPVFPVFNRDLILDKSQRDLDGDDDGSSAAVPSSSSSEVDELDAVPSGSYCVWMPKPAAAAQQEARGKCKIKSKSTGSTSASSKRWRLRDLLRRSNSDGKDSFVFLTPSLSSSSSKKVVDDGKVVAAAKEKKSSGSDGPHSATGRGNNINGNKGPNAVSMAHEVFYVRNKTLTKDGYNKRRSYLPYRQDLVGFFASVNAMSRTFPTF